jgi:ATP-binding cassette subfamily B protein
MLVVTNPKLALWVLAVVPAVVAPIVLFGRKVRLLSREAQARVADMVSEGGETLDAVRTVQAFAQEDSAGQRFGRATERAFDAAVARIARRSVMTTLVIFIVFSAVGFLLWMGGQDVIAGEISAGDLSAFVFYAVLVASSGGAISETIGDLQRASGAAERLAELRAEQPVIREPSNPKSLPRPVKGALVFDDLSFRYPTRPDSLALDRFTLRIAPGETIAIVGPSGAGKTTVFNLLLRFYDPEKGAIRLDGVDIRDLRLAELRGALSIVPQEPVLFTASVAENIRYGRPGASDAEVREAARAASALDFIEALPQGFATDLGTRGVRLSGGQRQRIAVARALLCDPAVLLLDEATSALDAESELAVQTALDRIMHKKTTLVIAHRLATVQKADRIVVLEAGQVVDVGSHGELVRRGGLYARLAELQFNISAAAE